MPDDLKNKLLQFEAVPPAGAWEKIAVRLDEEFVAGDGAMALKLENAVIEPPSNVWSRIEAELDETASSQARVVPMYRRMAVAAAVIGVLVLGGIYFLGDNNKAEQQIVVNNSSLPATTPQNKAENFAESLPIPSHGGVDASVVTQNKTLLRRGRGGSPQKQMANFVNMDINDPKPVQMVAAMEPVQIEAPPIRDENGNVIMDLSVISKPNEAYITVTSPNGSQTKISKKFLSCLNYMNGSYSSSEINYEGQQWKSRFAEWRNKISEAGFVPGANNFFDIFELQELIRD